MPDKAGCLVIGKIALDLAADLIGSLFPDL
jgi:hypothetical protein